MRHPASGLKALRITVSGTRHEGRPALLRTLRVGSQVSLARREKNPYDDNAVAVVYRKRQLGWIPRSANLAILGLKVEKGSIVEVGTADDGSWTHLVVEFLYEPTSAVGKLVNEHGAVVASVLKQMHVPDLKVARSIAQLPTAEQRDAVAEWNEMQTAQVERDKEEASDETEGPRQGGRRRRSAS